MSRLLYERFAPAVTAVARSVSPNVYEFLLPRAVAERCPVPVLQLYFADKPLALWPSLADSFTSLRPLLCNLPWPLLCLAAILGVVVGIVCGRSCERAGLHLWAWSLYFFAGMNSFAIVCHPVNAVASGGRGEGEGEQGSDSRAAHIAQLGDCVCTGISALYLLAGLMLESPFALHRLKSKKRVESRFHVLAVLCATAAVVGKLIGFAIIVELVYIVPLVTVCSWFLVAALSGRGVRAVTDMALAPMLAVVLLIPVVVLGDAGLCSVFALRMPQLAHAPTYVFFLCDVGFFLAAQWVLATFGSPGEFGSLRKAAEE